MVFFIKMTNKLIKIKSLKIIIDMAINLLGRGIGLLVLNLAIYPVVARTIGADLYGQMQSIMSIIYILGGTLGVTLCSTRLVLDFEYNENNIKGDFNYIHSLNLLFISFLLPVVLSFYINKLQFIDYLLILAIGILNCATNYYIVALRLVINYKAIFISQLLGCIGYLFGFLFFVFFKKWELIFIFSLLFEVAYFILKSNIVNEPYNKTFLFSKTIQTYFSLGLANFLGKALIYFDKLIIYPLLGGKAVTIYYVSSIFGKIFIAAIEPITNVILSYLAKRKTVSKDLWIKVLLAAFLSCTIMFFICNFISVPIIRLLYPQWFDEAVKYITVCTLCLVMSAFIGLIRPFTLKTFESYKQIIINGVGLISYCLLVLLLHKNYGIYGCCYALIFSHAIKVFLIIFFCIGSFNNAK